MSTDRADAVETPQAGSGQKPAPRPFWIGIGLVAAGLVWLWGGLSLPQGARYAAIGPGLMVTLVGGGLVLLGLILTIQIFMGETFEPQDAEDAAANASMDKRAFLTALAAVVLPIGTLGPLGLPLTATVCFALVARAFGSQRLIVDLVTGAVLGTVAWLAFTQLGLQLGRFFPPLGF